MEPKIDVTIEGFIPEPTDDPAHWSFEQKLSAKLPYVRGDIDLRPYSSPIHNQRTTPTCVSNAVVKALETMRILKYGRAAHRDLSVLALHYYMREQRGAKFVTKSGGGYISHACHALRNFGVPLAVEWPFNVKNELVRPPLRARQNGHMQRIKAFYKVKSRGAARVDAVIHALRTKRPVVFGTATGANWGQYAPGDVLELPEKRTGRHATCLVGYKDGVFLGENSWGSGWGDKGFYRMAPSVIESYHSKDFWVITGTWE